MYLFGRSLRAVAASATLGAGFVGASIQNAPPNVTTDLTAKKQEPSVKLPPNKLTDQQAQHSNSWSSAVTDFRSNKHSHSWTIRGFSQCQCPFKETIFKPITSSSKDSSPTFRVRLLPVSQNYVRFQVHSDDPRAKYLATISLYNGRNEKIGTKTFSNDIRRQDHLEEIPRESLLSQIGPEDELRVEVDLTVTFDTTITDTSAAKGNKTEASAVKGNKMEMNPAEDKTEMKSEGTNTEASAVEGNEMKMNSEGEKTVTGGKGTEVKGTENKRQSATALNQSALRRTVFISLYQSGSDRPFAEQALVDTGADSSGLKPSVAQAFVPWDKTNLPPSACIRGVSGGAVPVQGQVFLDVRIGDTVLRGQRFLVADFRTAQDVILGTDFHDAVGPVTFHKDFMQMNGETIPYASGGRGSSVVCKSIAADNKSEASNEEEKAGVSDKK